MNLAQIVQSHALSFFHLSAPDLLLGWESNPAKRNVFGLIETHPELARGGIRLRQFGQEIIEALGGRKIHPAWSVPGGVRDALKIEARDRFLARLPEAHAVTKQALDYFKGFLDSHNEETQVFGNFPSIFMGMVTPSGDWEYYDGLLRFMDGAGKILADCDPIDYEQYLGERVEKDSYLKSPYFKPIGYPEGVYRVGPLARVNICGRMGVPNADRELLEFRQRAGGVANASFFFHYARLLEIGVCLEHLERMLPDPDLQSTDLRAEAGVNRLEGIGVSEAPRGTLFHHYHVDPDGLLTKVDLLIATGQNALAMNRTVTQIAKHYVKGATIAEPILNRIEAGIRAFDPCLSCSTHAVGQMPLHVELRRADGTLLQEIRRDS
jgi:NAD-reducing hydrogenase large subunit